MESKETAPSSIDQYISQFPPDVQAILAKLREVVREAAPQASEKMSYGMPTFFLHGNLVHFAAFKNHIGFYPTPTGIDSFKDELSRYRGAKGSVQFPIKDPVPYELIGRIVKFRVAENEVRAGSKAKKK